MPSYMDVNEMVRELRGPIRVNPNEMEKFEAKRYVKVRPSANTQAAIATLVLNKKEAEQYFELKQEIPVGAYDMIDKRSGEPLWKGVYNGDRFVNQESRLGITLDMLKEGGKEILGVLTGTLVPQPAYATR